MHLCASGNDDGSTAQADRQIHKQGLLERLVLRRRILPPYVPLPALSSASGPALNCRSAPRHSYINMTHRYN